MGLDVTAYGRVAFLREYVSGEEWDDDKGECNLYPESHFAARADGLRDGVYANTGERFDFSARSYSGYGRWRATLASMIGRTPEEIWETKMPGPFYELIDFSDCEGTIGPVTSAKLAQDFHAHHATAKANPDARWVRLYEDFMRAFDMAKDGGAVKFH